MNQETVKQHEMMLLTMFAGYICAAVPELHNFEVPKMLEHIDNFVGAVTAPRTVIKTAGADGVSFDCKAGVHEFEMMPNNTGGWDERCVRCGQFK